ncbi:MAG: hypothetical protein OXF09_06135 [Hyphomicrobiales bacterium]|nr:hypothetical protein [Hyphomicrobiales bacterium]
MSRKKQIPIEDINFDNLPSDEELEAMGDLKPINATTEEICGKVLFPEDNKIRKTKKDVVK